MTHWTADGKGVRRAGNVGGDPQVDDAYAAGYYDADRPDNEEQAVVIVYFYAIDTWELPWTPGPADERYAVEMLHEWVRCTDRSDPGGTERWSDVEHHLIDGSDTRYARSGDADRAAYKAACSHRAAEITWDGVTT